MYSDKELQISNISYTNKDFQKLYPEITELVNTLTSRWDPNSTNESDPLVALLKLLGFMGDKINYNCDQGALQAHIPSATQESAFRDIVETQGYNMKYYRSATTNISIQYNGDVSKTKPIKFDKFTTQFTDDNNEIIYSLVESVTISEPNYAFTGKICEGTFTDLLINGNSDIQLNNLDSNNRLFFPTKYVAENQVYIKTVDEPDNWTQWTKVDNLNLYSPNKLIYKFGYDSNKELPYIQFPDDIVELISNGLNVKYVITSGYNGNVPARKLNTLYQPSESNLKYDGTDESVITQDENTNTKLLIVLNSAAATNGLDPEDIDEAYFNFKRTIGTFNTLINCRDFANYLFSYLDNNGYPIVGNAQVTDRRVDINYSIPIITLTSSGPKLDYSYPASPVTGVTINPFDLVLYPLNYINNINTEDLYKMSFTPSQDMASIPAVFEDSQSIDHTYIKPEGSTHRFLYKNYYGLDVKLTTTRKVNNAEREQLIKQVKQALFDNFNSRKVNYGQELSYDYILETIKNANPLIRSVSLDEPKITTKVMYADKEELEVFANGSTDYLVLLAKNILAGKVNLFEYDEDFDYSFGQIKTNEFDGITSIDPQLVIDKTAVTGANGFTLQDNQVVQLFSPSFAISSTAVAGVNYMLTSTDPSKTSIAKDTTYKLSTDEILKLNATNSDGVNLTYIYSYTSPTWTKVTMSGTQVLSTEKLEYVIIKPNFQLYYGERTTILVGDTRYNTLSTSEEIAFLNKITTKLENKTNAQAKIIKMYWYMDNIDNSLFNTDDIVDGKMTTILTENEYLIYADDSMSQVEIFGAGTKLVTNMTGTVWTLDKSKLISLSELDNTNLSTYAAVQWREVVFRAGDYVQVDEQNILTLTSGDTFTFETQPSENLTSTLKDVESKFTYKIYGETDWTPLENNVAGENWKIRTRLDINCGPMLPQEIVCETNKFTETLTIEYDQSQSEDVIEDQLMLNTYIQRSGNTPLIVDTDLLTLNGYLFKYQEPVIGVQPNPNVMKWYRKTGDNYYLATEYTVENGDYYNLQIADVTSSVNSTNYSQMVTDGLYLHTVETDTYTKITTETYDASEKYYQVVATLISKNPQALGWYVLDNTGVMVASTDTSMQSDTTYYLNAGSPLPINNDGNIYINLENYRTQTIDLIIPMPMVTGKSSLVTMLYNKNTINPSSESITLNGFSYQNLNDSMSSSNLQDGVNTLQIESVAANAYTRIVVASDSTSNLTIYPIKIREGINSKFNLSNDEKTPLINTILNMLGTNKNFYYMYDVPNDRIIDTNDFRDPSVMWDINNVVNRFTLAELDFDNSSIDVVKSSRS